MGDRERHILKWRLTAVCTVLGFAACPLSFRPLMAQQVWFAMRGMEYEWNGVRGHEDWDRLFLGPNPQWPRSLDHISVVLVTPQTLSRISVSDLRHVVARLRERGVSLAAGMLAQAHHEQCGETVEGYAEPGETAAIAAKIKEAGGELRFAAMDEPLWFGHYYRGKGACRLSVADVAHGVASNVSVYLKAFPNIVIGDIEPLPTLTSQEGWQADYREWMEEFRASTGTPLAFLQLDIDWDWPRRKWQLGLYAAVRLLHRVNLPLGIIYNARPDAKNDIDWLAQAARHIGEIEGSIGIVPDQAIFGSWARFPTHGISDLSGPGQDYLLERYYQRHPGLPTTRPD